MRKKKINAEISSKSFGQHIQLNLIIDNSISVELCMILFLLKEELIKVAELNFINFTFFLRNKNGNQATFSLLDIDKGVFDGNITNNVLEYILYFLLKYYRDGIGEAEHIDVDFKDKNGYVCTLTLNCKNFQEYSEEEIRKMLE